MKRDVKVGLFVAAVVCGVAAILLGGGLSARTPGEMPALRLGGDAAGSEEDASADDRAAPVPDDLAGDIEPPAETELAAEDAFFEVADAEADLGATVDEFDDLDPDWPAAAGVDDDLAAQDTSPDLFDVPAEPLEAAVPVEPDLPAEPTAETPEDILAAWPAAGDGPVPSPEDVGVGEENGLDPAVPVDDGGILDEAVASEGSQDKRFYVIKDGESFWTITKKLYGAGKYYARVLKANPDVNPGRVRAGQVIAVPVIEGVELREELLATAEVLKRSRRPRVYLARDVRHVIRPGETLGDIAQKHYRSAIKWPHILVANPDLDPKRLRAGKEITVPALTEAPGMPDLPSEPRPRPRRRARTPKVYLAEDAACVVEPGDTLEKISRRHYGVPHKWPHITKDPRNAGIDARRLRPGDKIVVPALTE